MIKDVLHVGLRSYVRHFPIAKGKSRLLNLLWKPLSFQSYERQVILRQVNVKMNCDITKYIQRTIYFYGAYEYEYCALWMNLAKESRIVFDVGANVGIYSLLAAAVNPEAAVHSFEPTPEVYKSLLANIELNNMKSVVANSYAISESEGINFVNDCKGVDGTNEGMNFVTPVAQKSSALPVEAISIQTYCNKHHIDQIDLMKIDIEGGEYSALLGAQDLLKKKAIKYIFLELSEWAANRSGHSTSDIKRILGAFNYRIYRLYEGKLTPLPAEGVHYSDNNVIACAYEPTSNI